MKRLILTICACVLFASTVALGDWDPGDDYKMHWPQLPDPEGIDVCLVDQTLADDWQCIKSGPVTDVHFWVSWEADLDNWEFIDYIHLSIHDNIPVGPGGFSIPGNALWSADIYNYIVAGPWEGDQDFHCPSYEVTILSDHINYWQINITDIPDPFYQEQDQVYWLDIQIALTSAAMIGWKSTLPGLGFNDYPVWFNDLAAQWELVDPYGEGTIEDFAFVITPEPATLFLLGLGALVLLRKPCK